jgi:hypothetical protein
MHRIVIALAIAAAATLPALAGEQSDPRCAEYGKGFIYSETAGMCVKISGEIRSDYKMGNKTKAFDSRGEVTFDARRQTDFGELRIVVSPKASN